jgi:chromosome segregation ATPase
MSITDILQEHQAWIEQARKSLIFDQDMSHQLAIPIEAKRQRIEQLKMRVEDLSRQKDAVIRRYEETIAQYRAELTRLEADLSSSEKLRENVAASKPS